MSLSKSILSKAIKNVPRYSFTRQALLAATSSTEQSDLLESVFGSGIEPERALVREWEEQGLKAIAPTPSSSVTVTVPKGKSQREVDFEALRSALERRIRWSSDVGEHLVQVRLSPYTISPCSLLVADGW